MPKDYSRFIEEIKSYPLSEFLGKEIPGIRFKKEKGEWGTEYLKAKCFISQSISRVPTFYIDKTRNLFCCHDCGAIGGIVNLLYTMGLDDSKAFRKIEEHVGIEKNLSEEDKKSILFEIWEDEDYAQACFQDTYLAERSLDGDGKWRKYWIKTEPECLPEEKVKF